VTTVPLEYVLAYIFSECNSLVEEKPLMDASREILKKAIEKGYCIDVSLENDRISGLCRIPEATSIIRKWIRDCLLEHKEEGNNYFHEKNTNSFKSIHPYSFKIILSDYKSYYPKLNDFENDIKEILNRNGF
jgi:hypothetical protein